MRVQRRGRALAMTPAELDEFLTAERTCRIATLSPDGPHVAALWFVCGWRHAVAELARPQPALGRCAA